MSSQLCKLSSVVSIEDYFDEMEPSSSSVFLFVILV